MTRILALTSCLLTLAAPVARAAAAKSTTGTKPAAAAKSATGSKPAAAAKSTAGTKPPAATKKSSGLTAQQIVDRNVRARGGLEAWRAVNTLTMTGEMGAGGKTEAALPFVLSLKRPLKSRLEITFAGKNAVQVFDGTQGWKLRPFLNRDDVEPFKRDELESAASQAELDGPLVDYARKGTRVELAGTEKVEGKKTYKLALTLKSGAKRFVWVDASTFLERKTSGDPRKLDGRPRSVEIFTRDYRTVGGLKIPFVLETVVEGVKQRHKIVVKAVKVNPKLDDALFAKPTALMASVSGK
jgi:outer membrane lipoprotein-sorting protein